MDGFEKFQTRILEASLVLVKPITEQQEEELEEVIQNHLFKRKGPTVLLNNLSVDEQAFQKIFYGYIEIADSLDSLKDVEIYIRKFPFSGTRVKKVRYLQFIIEAYLHEIYILKERLISYLVMIKRLYKKTQQEGKSVDTSRRMSKIVLAALERPVSVRGAHVHRYRFSDDDLDRLRGLEVIKTGQNNDVINKYFDLVYREVRGKWLRRITENNLSTHKLLSAYFLEIYDIIFTDSGEFRYPQKDSQK